MERHPGNDSRHQLEPPHTRRVHRSGGKAEYDQSVSQNLIVGAFVGGRYRFYPTEPSDSGSHRQDFLLAPGVSFLFPNIFGIAQTDFRVDYEYDHNQSNASGDSYDDHIVTLAFVTRR